MNAKITAALCALGDRAPDLAQALDGYRFVPSTEGLTTFTLRTNGTIEVHPDLLDEDPQDEVNFSLGVVAFCVANEVKARGQGRDILIWGMVCNLSGQSYVRNFLPAPPRVAKIEANVERQWPGATRNGFGLEALYNGITALEGGSAVHLN